MLVTDISYWYMHLNRPAGKAQSAGATLPQCDHVSGRGQGHSTAVTAPHMYMSRCPDVEAQGGAARSLLLHVRQPSLPLQATE